MGRLTQVRDRTGTQYRIGTMFVTAVESGDEKQQASGGGRGLWSLGG